MSVHQIFLVLEQFIFYFLSYQDMRKYEFSSEGLMFGLERLASEPAVGLVFAELLLFSWLSGCVKLEI